MRIYPRAGGAYNKNVHRDNNKNVHRDNSIYCPQNIEQKSPLQDILSYWNFNPANANKSFRINVVGMRTGYTLYPLDLHHGVTQFIASSSTTPKSSAPTQPRISPAELSHPWWNWSSQDRRHVGIFRSVLPQLPSPSVQNVAWMWTTGSGSYFVNIIVLPWTLASMRVKLERLGYDTRLRSLLGCYLSIF